MKNEKVLSLNGEWDFITDSLSELNYTSFLIEREKNSKKIKLPINWELAGLNNFNGTVWFYHSFNLNDINNPGLSLLRFGGVDYFADVWVNGQFVGSHEGYFQSFYHRLNQSYLQEKNNEIVVRVTSPKEEPGKVWPYNKKLIKGIFNHHDCRPGGWSMEYGQDKNTGGIWNDVELLTGKNLYFDSVKVTSKIDRSKKSAKLLIDLSSINNFTVPSQLSFQINIKYKSKSVYKNLFSKSINPLTDTFNIALDIDNPKLWDTWDLGEPNLYELSITSEESYSFKKIFGIRNVELKESNRFFINGKELFLRGTNIIPTQMLSSFNNNKIKILINLLKEANINIVRVHAHVNRNELYEEFDNAGILVWQDFPLQWTYDTSNLFVINAVKQIKEMVNQFYNHPSIAFWCCHNEPGEQIKSLDPFLYDAVLQEDQSRIIRIASNYEEHPYDGWYWGNKEHFAATPMGPLVTEFGAQAIPELSSLKKIISEKGIKNFDVKEWEYHNFQYEQTFNIAGIEKGKSTTDFINNSQTYQADLLKTAIDFYRRKKNDGITGIFQFMFIDCWESITWSVVDFFGKKKKGFYAVKQAYQPIYVSVKVMKEKYFNGQDLSLDLWVINDLYKSYKNCSIEFSINNKIFSTLVVKEIATNSVTHLLWNENKIPLPAKLSYKDYKIDLRLKSDDGKTISENSFVITIVRNR
jgi:beta-mannosidase